MAIISRHTTSSVSRRQSPTTRLWLFRGLLLLLIGIIWSMLATTLQHPIPDEDSPLLQLHKERKTKQQRGAAAATNSISTTRKTSSTQQQQLSLSNTNKNRTTDVAYVVTITSCEASLKNTIPFQITEAAAVLQYSITKQQQQQQQQQQHSSSSSSSHHYYRPVFYAIHHPDALACAAPLGTELGFKLIERNTPVRVEDIKGDVLRERIVKNGCCGERELIKLEAWTLTDYPVVVLLDLDVLVRQSLDGLFDFLLDSTKVPPSDDLLWGKATAIPETINLLYTTDFAMVPAGRKVKPTQGGFVVLRPSQKIYQDFVDIVTEGDFRDDGGWHGKTGKFWGAMTFQGLIPLYFQILHPNTAVELNWCVWDNMCSPSREDKLDDKHGACLTQQENCEDCRNRPMEQVKLLHFTVCQKPWTCIQWPKDAINHNLCRAFHHAWFQERAELERSWGRTGMGEGTWNKDHFLGYCKSHGARGYIPMEQPLGQAVLSQ